jgi:hypothetical protein
MAHFAEIDSNNKVLKVIVACNQDIIDNGGEQSVQAAKQFESVVPLSSNGVKWVQTSYNNSFRKKFAAVGDTYNEEADLFYRNECEYASWTLDSNFDWQPPVAFPSTYVSPINGNTIIINWNEEDRKWTGFSYDNDNNRVNFDWNSNTNTWVQV